MTHKIKNFPGGQMVQNLPRNAEDMRSIPSWGTKIPHVAEQLNPCTTTTDPIHWSPCATARESVHCSGDPA